MKTSHSFICALGLLGVINLTSVEAQIQKVDSLSVALESAINGQKQDSIVQPEALIQDDPLHIGTITGDDRKSSLADMRRTREYDSLWLAELHDNSGNFVEIFTDLDSTEVDQTYIPELPTDTLIKRLAHLDSRTPFNISYNKSLERVIKSFLTRRRGLMERMMAASQFYFPLFEEHLDRFDMPLEIKYLAVVESALNPRARSRVGATGLWQFMYSTGKLYKLDVNSYVDERRDPVASTVAACEYLTKLHSIFNDWDLALAAYNSGPGNVNKAIRRSGGYKNYWDIRRNLPRETAGYLPAFLATMYIFEYAEEHQLVKKEAPRPYFTTDTIKVKELVSFDQISKQLGISVEELEQLNPQYKLNIIPNIEGKDYYVRLPITQTGQFVANEETIYAHARLRKDSLEKARPKIVESSKEAIRYRVRNGDYLGKIAERYGVGVSQIKRWNGLRSSRLRIGQRLTIYPRKTYRTNKPKNTAVASNVTMPSDPNKVHIVRSGDSLWTISRQYPGVTIEKLRKWNGISGKNLKPGTKLKLCDCSS